MATETTSPNAENLTMQANFPSDWTLADLQAHLGAIPLERIRLVPPLGCATEEDVLNADTREDRLCELEDGILVEKPMGWYESFVALLIATEINNYLRSHDLGKAFGADGTVKILPGIIKIPDVSFISWQRWPKQPPPRRPIPAIVPDLVVEVLSDTNTPAEMENKLKRYFEAGVRLAWYIDPPTRSAKAYTALDQVTEVPPNGVLDGGEVLPGFELSLQAIFDEADRQGPRSSQ